jgi:hypothetical protein
VVIRCGASVIKGYLESPPWHSATEALQGLSECDGDIFRIRHLESNEVEEIPASEVKAVFFVNSLDGELERNDFRFHALEPVLSGVWIQVQFRDGEIIEGVVENSIRYLKDPGFFLKPTDPGSNNKLIYVMKDWLVEHHVLGLTEM